MLKKTIKTIILVGVVAAIICLSACESQKEREITALEITPGSVTMPVGVSSKPVVKGLYKDGSTAPSEKVEELDLCWDFSCGQHAFTVEQDGTITALHTGEGRVWVITDDESISSEPISVFIK